MSYCTRLLVVLLLFVKQEVDLAIIVRKFVYQKDMSEYCRRRVMPSVFLGRQVVDAYSQILHFSRLELPYSCFVSVRTESGSNIILVIQLMSGNSLIESCRESNSQLLVYEIGETFGGYWGALPNNMIKVRANTEESQHYTLKTTQPTITTTTTKRTTTRRITPSTTMSLKESTRETTKRENEFVVEIPIVNVSGVLVPGVQQESTSFDEEETFDKMIDVKPKPDMDYKTKVLPLVQFAISDDVIAQRTNDEDVAVAPRYEFNLNADIFTPDPRLSFPLLRLSTKKKERGKYKYNNLNSRLDFKKNKKLFAEKQALFHRTSYAPQEQVTFGSKSNDIFPRRDFIESTSQKNKETSPKSNPYEIVDAILKNLSKTKDEEPKIKVKIDKDVQDLLQGLAKIGYNESVYLVSNASWNTRRPASPARRTFKKYRTDSITWRQPSASYSYRTNYFEEEEDESSEEGSSQDTNESSNSMQATDNNDTVIIDVLKSGPLLPPDLDIDRVLLNVTHQNNEMVKNPIIVNPETFTQRNNEMEKSPLIVYPDTLASEVNGTTTTDASPETVIPMTLVDHESWENMVQAASLMAVVLNQSITSSVSDEHQAVNATLLPPTDGLRRKKRYIHAIPIEFAKPHHIPVKKDDSSSTQRADRISDLQEIQQLIELQDDEVHDRVALRYLGQYLGPALFNICDFDEAAAGHTFLFNSSRLVLAINNFTLERMTVVMTPARTLLTSAARCAAANLECQVSGARVCIDSLCACDGVPNCGKYDIYDEDHLKCGGSARLQHNVYLAAVTFLAVLLTMLYIVHYWLKRCVPKVSDAFFIYTDAAENILYLDPIMRSPHDTEDPKDFYRGTAMHDYMECTDMRIQTKQAVGSFITRWTKCLRCKRQKKHSQILDDQIIDAEYDVMDPGERRFFSFAEVELGRMGTTFTVDAAVQTGSSLDIVMNEPFIKEQMIKVHSDSEDIVAHYEGKPREIDRRSFLDIGTPIVRETSDELSILNFFKRARSVSMQMSEIPVSKYAEIQAMYPLPNTEEKEIQCHDFDQSMTVQLSESLTATTGETSNKKNEGLKKKLRFEEEMTTIHVSDDEILEEDPGGATDQRPRRSVVYGSSRNHNLDESNSNGNVDEPSTSTGNREFKSYFWGGKSKSKKSKKKTQQFNLR